MPKRTTCKFKLTGMNSHDPSQSVTITMEPVYDPKGTPEDQAFTKYTPSGKLETVIANPNVLPMFALGKKYLIHIEEIEEEEAPTKA